MKNRSGPTPSPTSSDALRVRFDRFELDEANARLTCDGNAIALPPTPFALLCTLARRPGALVTKNELLDEVWGHRFVSESALKTVIKKLRTVLDDDAHRPRFIETVSRRGYRFIAPVTALPSASSALSSAPWPETGVAPGRIFIGREDALARLRGAWDRACAGRRMVVWVAGDPGIGKTELIERFVAGLGDLVHIRGQCVEQFGSGEPYLPVLEALSELCRRDSAVAPLLRAVAPSWLLQLPWLSTEEERSALQRELAGGGPERMLREMGELFDRYTETRPLLLVTEDLHWSDRATLQLMDHVARRRGSGRLMWLASFRLAEVIALEHPLKALRHELRLHGLCEEIVLDPFSEREVGEYVAERAPSLAADEAFVRVLHERTDGLPLFLSHVMTDVIACVAHTGSDAASQVAKMAVPENLAGIVDYRISRLAPAQRQLLEAAAVCGLEFRISSVSDALRYDAGTVETTCDQLVREQLWLNAPGAEDGRPALDRSYSFRHAILRQVLYERIGTLTRARLHREVGAALERERAAGMPVTAAELATHFERGDEPITALRYYAEAAETALLHLSPSECQSLTECALTLLEQAPQGTERDALEISLATLRGVAATHVLGMGLEAKHAFQRAYSLLHAVPQHPMRRRLLQGFGFLLCLRAEYAEAQAVAERAEEMASDARESFLLLAACVVHGDVDQLQGRSRSALQWLERGLAAADPLEASTGEISVTDPQVMLLGLLGIQLLQLGRVEQGRERLQRAHDRANRLGQPMARMAAIWCNALFEVRLGNAQRVAALADEMRALVEEFALAHGRMACRWFRGWADARMGQPREAYRCIRIAYEENIRLGMVAGASEVLGYAAEALMLAGDWEAAQQELEQAFQIANRHGERVYLPQLFLLEAAIAHARGQSADACASIRCAVSEARVQEAPWLELMALLELCDCGGAAAEEWVALAAIVGQLGEATDTAPLARAKALLEGRKPI